MIQKALEFLTRICTICGNYTARVYAICDCFIIGTEEIWWSSEEKVITKQHYLSVKFIESTIQKSIPIELRN